MAFSVGLDQKVRAWDMPKKQERGGAATTDGGDAKHAMLTEVRCAITQVLEPGTLHAVEGRGGEYAVCVGDAAWRF